MVDNELLAVLRLQNLPHIGDITAKKLITHCGSPTAVFSDKVEHLLKIEGIGKFALKDLHASKYQRAAEAEFEYIRHKNISYTYYEDEAYPYRLKHCIDGPILLFRSGNINLEKRKTLSVVGTRNATGYGLSFCRDFIEEIAPFDPVIVSGFAYGIDICAHRAALECGLQTIGCLAHGLNQIYPKEHVRYLAEVERNGGLFTEFWSTSQPGRKNFLKRNRVIAGISEATVVIESAERGGGLVTADLAQSYNREVFAVPGRVQDKYSEGCNNLIKTQKAHVLTSAADLVYIMNWDLETEPKKSVQAKLFVELDEVEKSIYTYLQRDGKQLLDTIALECQVPVFKASSTLLNMEMKGVIRPLPGKLFEVI